MTETGKTLARPWDRFIALLAETGGNISASCRATGIPRRTAYSKKERDSEFATRWDEAITTGVERLEAEARRRAFDGVPVPVYQQGKLVGTIQRYSDRLLELLLKAHKPEKYQELFGKKAKSETPIVKYNINLDRGNPR